MLRFLWSLVLTGLVGGGFAALAANTFGLPSPGPFIAYSVAVVIGVIMGLFTGTPVWVKGARIEAGLKAVFGAFASAGLMLALRSWATFDVDLSAYGVGQGPAGTLAVITFPAIALALALLFSIDSMFGSNQDSKQDSHGKVRVASPTTNKRIGRHEETDDDLRVANGISHKRKR